jgi:hypothetical protein
MNNKKEIVKQLQEVINTIDEKKKKKKKKKSPRIGFPWALYFGSDYSSGDSSTSDGFSSGGDGGGA